MNEVIEELLESLQCAKNSLVAFKFLPGDANRWEESDEANLAAVDRAIATTSELKMKLIQVPANVLNDLLLRTLTTVQLPH